MSYDNEMTYELSKFVKVEHMSFDSVVTYIILVS